VTQELPLDVARIRQDFPGLHQDIGDKPLVYLDNAATTQKPRVVIDAITHFYEHDCANIHRGVHTLSQRATTAYEDVRGQVARFINATSTESVVFTSGTTESINLVAQTYGRAHVGAGDEVLVSHLEHHSNIVPWQLLCDEVGATVTVIPVNDAGEWDLSTLDSLLTERTKLVSVAHVSNALGTINPIEDVIERAHAKGIPVLIDGAQGVPHLPVDVQALGCEFYAFSGHKVFGPTGVGVLVGREELLAAMPPWQGGGDMIEHVRFEGTTYAAPPNRFEAGTPNIADVIGLGAALSYVEGIGMAAIARYEHDLMRYGSEVLSTIPGLRMIGTAAQKGALFSFVMEEIHPHDIGTILDHEGIAIRSGHHCAQPVMEHFGISATARASLAFYNTRDEVDALAAGLHKVLDLFA
jgi:cysteine desulfurase/selenocysteine lyase